tara:strand:+ start:2137 stop:2310 length:174 start_codon:yes stop_codon:yes gene_type:complete
MAWFDDEEGAWMLKRVINSLHKGKYRRAVKWVDNILEEFKGEVTEDEIWTMAGAESN